MKNISIPNDMSVIVAYIALIFIAWYIIMWVTRFIIGIIWPLFLIGTALVSIYTDILKVTVKLKISIVQF